MKHVAIDYHFVRDQVERRDLRVAHVASSDQLADSLTKSLPSASFSLHRTKLGVLPGPVRLRGHDR